MQKLSVGYQLCSSFKWPRPKRWSRWHRSGRDSMSRWDSSRILGWASRWPCFRWQHMTSFFCYSASVDPGTIQQFFAKSPHIPFILSITKPWPKGNKNTIRPCCTWMEVGRPAIRWSSGRYGIHKVWIEAMKMWCLFFSGSDLFLKMETLLCHCI